MQLQNIVDKYLASQTVTADANSEAVNISGAQTLAMVLSVTVNSPVTGATAKLQKSNGSITEIDPANWEWFDEGNPVNITATSSLYLEKENPTAKYYRVAYTLATGSMSVVVNVTAKGMR